LREDAECSVRSCNPIQGEVLNGSYTIQIGIAGFFRNHRILQKTPKENQINKWRENICFLLCFLSIRSSTATEVRFEVCHLFFHSGTIGFIRVCCVSGKLYCVLKRLADSYDF